MARKQISNEQRKRLTYVVPGYVWQQKDFELPLDEETRRVLESRAGVLVIKSPSEQRREYAVAILLAQFQGMDYHADIGWRSFFPLRVNEFTDAFSKQKIKKVMAISVKTPLDDRGIDQLADLAAMSEVAIIACDVPVAERLQMLRHEIVLSASTKRTVSF